MSDFDKWKIKANTRVLFITLFLLGFTISCTNKNKKTDDKGQIIINRIARYRNKRYEYMRYFTVIYDKGTGKTALVQTYGLAKKAHNKVVNSIRFK